MVGAYKTRLLVLAFFAFVVFGVFSVNAAEFNVSSCGILNESDSVYTLVSSLTLAGQTCLTVQGNNIEIRGGFMGVDGQDINQSIGVHINHSNNVTVSQIFLLSLGTGLLVESSSNVSVLSMADTGSITGFELYNVSESTITSAGGSTFGTGDSQSGLVMRESSNNVLNVNFYELTGDALSMVNSNNNTLNNFSSSLSGGVVLEGSSSNIFESLYLSEISGLGVLLSQNSGSNLFRNALILNVSETGLLVDGSASNNFLNVSVSDADVGFRIDSGANNVFEQISASNARSNFSLWVNSSATGSFIDSYIEGYNIVEGTISVRRLSYGQVRFLVPVTASGGNFSDSFQLFTNLLRFNGAIDGLNRSSEIMLEGNPQGRTNYRILRNNETCPSDICTAVSELDDSTVLFNINQFGNYTIASDASAPPAPAPAPAPAASSSSGSSSSGGSGGSSSSSGTNREDDERDEIVPLADVPTNETAVNATTIEQKSWFGGVTGAVVNSLKKPSFFVPAVFVLGLVGLFFFLRAKNAGVPVSAQNNSPAPASSGDVAPHEQD